MKLLKVDSVEKVEEKIWDKVSTWNLETETISLDKALDKVLAVDLFAKDNIPGFNRSTVDGYAVIANDTAAASETIPVFLKNMGIIEMGKKAEIEIKNGECVEISTGGMLPINSDGVVMVEYTDGFGKDGIAVYSGIAVGENLLLKGEDAVEGQIILKKGQRLLPQHIGSLAAMGIVEVEVFKPLTITIISTGDELVEPDKKPKLGEVRDINSYALKSLAEKNGFKVLDIIVLKDKEELLKKEVEKAKNYSDIVAISGGSSKGKKDFTAKVLDELSSEGVFTHGMAIKPGKPTIVAYDKDTETILTGLPGHPVSAMLVFDILFNSMIAKLMNIKENPKILAELTVNLGSSPGKMTCWPVRIENNGDRYFAEPIFGKSGLITTLVEADGYFIVNRNDEGLDKGREVLVKLF